jgi:small neutral amino acid transporter SnatA (MarC family)
MHVTWHKRFLQAALALAALVLLLIPTAASARIYKWIDETGTTVFSDAPPENAAKAKSFR